MDEHWYLSKLYALLAKRPKTIFEVKEWLSRRKATDQIQKSIIEKLIQMRLLDDVEYTHAFVRTQKLLKPLSKRALIFKLQRKGISSKIIQAVLEDEGHDEVLAAQEEVRRTSCRWQKYPPEERKQKISIFLSRKGFSFDVIRRVYTSDGQD